MAGFLAPLLAWAAKPAATKALIGAGASLVGGALDRKAQREANAANSPQAQVKAWEDAGINPLWGISQGQWIPQQAASIGDAFATAGGQFASAFDDNTEQELRQTQLELQNDVLRKQLDDLSTPRVPSNMERYGEAIADITRPDEAVDAGNGLGSSGGVVASGRDVEIAPYTSGSGVTEITNDLTGNYPIVVPGSDGEPWGIDELATYLVTGGPQFVYHYGKNRVPELWDMATKPIGDALDWVAETLPDNNQQHFDDREQWEDEMERLFPSLLN